MFVNLTPHEITVRGKCLDVVTIPPSGQVARVEVIQAPDYPVGEKTPHVGQGQFVTVRNTYGPVTGLPDPVEGTIYIVSPMVLDCCQGCDDVVAPDSGKTAVRYADGPQKGQIQYVTQFVRPAV